MNDRMGNERGAGIAAIAGGAMYAVKAGAILLGFDQPPILFEAAPIAFGSCLALLGRLLAGRLARVGRLLAYAIVAGAVVNVLEELLTDREIVPALSSLVDAVTGFGPFVALLLLAWASRRQPTPWRPGMMALAGLYPLVILLFIPIGLVVDLDGDTGERLIELPILAIGVGWVVFGWSLAAPRDHA